MKKGIQSLGKCHLFRNNVLTDIVKEVREKQFSVPKDLPRVEEGVEGLV